MNRVVEWEGDRTRLVALTGLARSPSRSYRSRREPIESIIVHQSAGARRYGEDAAVRIARFHAGPPKYRDGRRVGGGRGWPGIGYTFVVPTIPDTRDGKLEVFRTQPDSAHTYHTGRGWNARGVAVCVAGTYRSRHSLATNSDPYAPDTLAMTAMIELIEDYLLPRYQLGGEALRGHFDAGKPACPGDFLEQWVRYRRGEEVNDPLGRSGSHPELFGAARKGSVPLSSNGPLSGAQERQQALVDLGYDVGSGGPAGNGVDGYWGEDSKGALEAFQADASIRVDGRWGPHTEEAVKWAMSQSSWPPT